MPKKPPRKPANRPARRTKPAASARSPRRGSPPPSGGKPKGKGASKPKADLHAVKHKDTRVNIPTEELRDFVREDDQRKTILYPRNPDLDPQLVWRGKDEQDAKPLEVPAVPIYIQ